MDTTSRCRRRNPESATSTSRRSTRPPARRAWATSAIVPESVRRGRSSGDPRRPANAKATTRRDAFAGPTASRRESSGTPSGPARRPHRSGRARPGRGQRRCAHARRSRAGWPPVRRRSMRVTPRAGAARVGGRGRATSSWAGWGSCSPVSCVPHLRTRTLVRGHEQGFHVGRLEPQHLAAYHVARQLPRCGQPLQRPHRQRGELGCLRVGPPAGTPVRLGPDGDFPARRVIV